MKPILSYLGNHKNLKALSLYVLLVAVFYAPVVFFGKTLQPSLYQPHGVVEGWPYGYEGRKPINTFNVNLGAAYNDWPKNKLIGDVYRQGDIPLWDPYRAAGTPLAAEYETRAFFPYQILQNISPVISWDYFLLGRLVIAGFFTYLFLSLFGLSFPAAFLGGVFYMFSGTFVWFINFEYITNISMVIPILLYCIETLIGKKGPRGVALSALAFGLVLLAGQPEIALYVLLLAAVYFLFRVFAEYYNNLYGLMSCHLKMGIAFALGLGLSAMLILPFLEFVRHSHNIHPPGGIMGVKDPAKWDYALSLITPTASEMPMDPDYITGMHGKVQGPSGNPFYYTVFPSNGEWDYIGGYIGALPVYLFLCAALIVFLLKRHSHFGKLIFFGSFGVFILLKNYGVWPVDLIGYLPLFDQVWSPRWATPAWTFSFAIAGAIGFDVIKDTLQEKAAMENNLQTKGLIKWFGRFKFRRISSFLESSLYTTLERITKNTIIHVALYWLIISSAYNSYKWWMKHINGNPLTNGMKASIKFFLPWLLLSMAFLYICLAIWNKKKEAFLSLKEYAFIMIFQLVLLNLFFHSKGVHMISLFNLFSLFSIPIILIAIRYSSQIVKKYVKTDSGIFPKVKISFKNDANLIFLAALIIFLIPYNKFLRAYLSNVYPKISFLMWPYFMPSVVIGVAASIVFVVAAILICLRYVKTGAGLYSLIFLGAIELWYAIPRGYDSRWLYLKLIPLTIGLFIVWAASQERWRMAVGGVLLFLLSFSIIDLKASHGFPHRHNPFTKAPYIDFLKKQDGYYRTVGGYGVLFPNFAGAMGIQDVRYISALAVAAYQEYRENHLHIDSLTRWNSSILWFTGSPGLYVYKNGVDTPSYRRIDEDIRANLPYYSLLGVKYILMPASKDINKDIRYLGGPNFPLVYDREIKIYENPYAIPRTFVAHGLEYAASYRGAQQAIKLKNFDLRQRVVLEEESPSWYQWEKLLQYNKEDAFIKAYQPNKVIVDANLERPGILVLTDVYYPGWKAYVDGKIEKIYRVDGVFRGVFLEKGRHSIIFKYMPMSFVVGMSMSIISLAICAALLAADKRKYC